MFVCVFTLDKYSLITSPPRQNAVQTRLNAAVADKSLVNRLVSSCKALTTEPCSLDVILTTVFKARVVGDPRAKS